MAVPQERLPSLANAIEQLMRHRLDEVHTVLPGRITAYTQATQLADVEVCVKHRVATDEGTTLVENFPVIPNVLVEHHQTASFFASFPVAVGDFVWLHIVEQSIDKWTDKGGVKVDDPIDRKFNLKDCYATLARNPTSPLANTETDAIVIGHKTTGPRVYFTDSIIGLGAKAPSSFVALATAVQSRLDALATAINGWTPVPNDGGSALKVALTAWLAGSNNVAATKVKAV